MWYWYINDNLHYLSSLYSSRTCINLKWFSKYFIDFMNYFSDFTGNFQHVEWFLISYIDFWFHTLISDFTSDFWFQNWFPEEAYKISQGVRPFEKDLHWKCLLDILALGTGNQSSQLISRVPLFALANIVRPSCMASVLDNGLDHITMLPSASSCVLRAFMVNC